MAFKKAERRHAKLRLAVAARSGGGKTFTAILMAKLFGPKRIGLADSERSSALKYARKAGTEEAPGNWDFDHDDLDTKSPQGYVEKIHEAAEAGIDFLIIDSYSHSWMTALEQIDAGGGWTRAGKNVSPRVQKLIDAILSYPGHVIATVRSKTEHAVEKDEKSGKTTMRKVGTAPVIRDGAEFDFDLWIDLDHSGTLTVSKSRFHDAGIEVGDVYTRDEIPALVEKIKAGLDQGAAETECDRLLGVIGFAQANEDLVLAIEQWKAAVGAKLISAEEHKRIGAAYTTRKRELAGATA